MASGNNDAQSRPKARRSIVVALLVLSIVGVAVAAASAGTIRRWLDETQARRAEAAVADSLRSIEDVLAWLKANPRQTALVVINADEVTTAISPTELRPTTGLPTLQLVAELSRRADAGLDLSVVVPAATIREQRLPFIEPTVLDTVALGLAALARAALRGDRAAADALLLTLGRKAVDTLPQQFGLDSLDAPTPAGGLMVAWAPGRMGIPAARELDAFLRAGRAAQRDSAFARSLALANSPSFRAEITERFRRSGLGLSADDQRRAALSTYPRGTALDYAWLLAQSDGTFLRLVTSQAPPDHASRGVQRIGVSESTAPGLRSVAGVRLGRDGSVRSAVLNISGAPRAVIDHLRHSRLDVALVRHLLTR